MTDLEPSVACNEPFAVLPAQFGRFHVLKRLGSGAMGTVYLAHDPEDERDIALKIPNEDLARDPALWERFQREARAVGDMNHDNICGMYEVGLIGTMHFIAMPYIVGRPLSDYISAETPPSQRQVATIIRRLARGLAHAHDRGIVHRDLKPANVIINRHGEPVIMDFGLALRTDSKSDIRATTSGVIVGSPAYMSPEQAQGEHDQIGPWTDIYGLGVLFFELLTGTLPFSGSLVVVLGQIATQRPPKPSSLRADVDPRLESLCLKMLEKQPQNRPASMTEVVKTLTEWLKRGSSSSEIAARENPLLTGETAQTPAKIDAIEAQKQDVAKPLEKFQHGASRVIAGHQSWRRFFHLAGLNVKPWQIAIIVALVLGLFVGSRLLKLTANPPSLVTGDSSSTATTEPFQPGVKAGDRRVVKLEGVDFAFRYCPPASFLMGSPADEVGRSKYNKENQVAVILTQGCWMLETEVTQAMYVAVMKGQPWQGQSYVKEGPNYPANYVSWNDATAFCEQLTAAGRREGVLAANVKIALPTEAQWECACRAGTTTAYSFGKVPATLGSYAWFRTNAWNINEQYPHQVGQKRANPWGLLDMHGNVWEWCQDCYQQNLPGGQDPVVSSSRPSRVMRGGSCRDDTQSLRCAHRNYLNPASRSRNHGFRVIVEFPEVKQVPPAP